MTGPSSSFAAGRLPQAFTSVGTSSFSGFLEMAAPELLPRNRAVTGSDAELAPHGTTIVAATFGGGVVMAGDRRATMGNLIASSDIEKVYAADSYSVIGCAGSAGIGFELMRLFCVELEHYEKIEGATLTLDGKANRLSAMLRGNLGMAMQGLAVVPIFAGYDLDVAPGKEPGRIFSFDVTGGCYPEERYFAIGSGSLFAKSALKKRYQADASAEQTVRLCLEALYDSAEDDSATGGPDLARKIYPIVTVVEETGVRRLADGEVGTVIEAVVADRQVNPGG